MSKIMVVEDDVSLREIYSIRITAEGYDVVSAGDGEEALAVAVREKPDLILSDVMMPKISGFDMLDILRSTPETANIKVIMMTALSADDQRQRGERLGADRYLVKSQVGIEDVINTIHEVLGDKPVVASTDTSEAPAAAPAMPTAQATSGANPMQSSPVTPEESQPAATTSIPIQEGSTMSATPEQAAAPAPQPIPQPQVNYAEPSNQSPVNPAQ